MQPLAKLRNDMYTNTVNQTLPRIIITGGCGTNIYRYIVKGSEITGTCIILESVSHADTGAENAARKPRVSIASSNPGVWTSISQNCSSGRVMREKASVHEDMDDYIHSSLHQFE
jgi:hypothetical protein